ncbi:MAG: hypothetical protein ACREFQ_07000, partial [Stellaceae bacterium]
MARMTIAAGTLPDLGEESRTSRIVEQIKLIALASFPIVLVLLVWDQTTCVRDTFCVNHPLTTPFLLPNPLTILDRIVSDAASGDLVLNVGLTLYRAFVGFVIAATGGIALGILIVRSHF